MNEEIIKGLGELRDRLTNLEDTYENKFSELEKRNSINENIDRKLVKIENYQNDLITIKTNTDSITTLKSNLLDCKYYNTLKDVIQNENRSQEVFYDIDSKYFGVFLDIIRRSRSDYIDEMNLDELVKKKIEGGNLKINVVVPTKLNKDIFLEALDKFFGSDAQKVKDDFRFKFKN